jgi:hypothetical protein
MVNVLYILVGVSGSGKSTYAQSIVKNSYGYILKNAICEADMFPGLYTNGKLNFTLLETAHIYCSMCVEERMKIGYKTIVQSNTNLELKNIVSYIKLAEKYDYKVYIVLPKYDLLYFDGIKDRKKQAQQLISARGSDRPNGVSGQVGYKHVPKEKILSMIRKFDTVKSKYEKLIKIHDPKELLKFL